MRIKYSPRRGDSAVATGEWSAAGTSATEHAEWLPDQFATPLRPRRGRIHVTPPLSGGVASLNRRLMALTPHGVDAGSYLSDIFPKTDYQTGHPGQAASSANCGATVRARRKHASANFVDLTGATPTWSDLVSSLPSVSTLSHTIPVPRAHRS